MFQAGVVFFVARSALCVLAQSMGMLVGARALQSIGGGVITVTASALIGEVVPLRERGHYQGMLGAVFGVTTVIGPLLGGYFTDYLTWRWAFWVNVPISVVVIVVAAMAIPQLAAATKPVIDYRLRATRRRSNVADPIGRRAGRLRLLAAAVLDRRQAARSPSFAGRPDRRVIEAALERIAHQVLAQRDWHDEPPTQALSAGNRQNA